MTQKLMPLGSSEPMNRRDMLQRAALAVTGIVRGVPSSSSAQRTSRLRGLAGEYDRYDGLGLAELVRKRQVTPLELLHAVRERFEALNPKLNALCFTFFDLGERQIAQGIGRGAFAGVPFVLKDSSAYLSGTVSSFACRLFQQSVANFDSTLVSRYKNAGLVIVGKSTTPELALAVTTESLMFGKTRNPWNLERTTGGSSGGAAAVVASRMLPMAHGADGGGSIRIPASCCGIFGLKPTRGRVPPGPVPLETWGGLGVHHALTVSVRDSAALLDISAGSEIGAPYSAPPQRRAFVQELGGPPRRLRIALVMTPPAAVPIDPAVKLAVTDAAKLCETLGHSVEETELPVDRDALGDAFGIIVTTNISRTLDEAARSRGKPLAREDVELVTWSAYQAGLQRTAVAYAEAIARCQQIGFTMAKFQEKYDVILSPTLGKPPISLDVLSLTPKDMGRFFTETPLFSPFTQLYNMTGQPSMSVPLHWTSDGLPIGVMFSARFGDEATLFHLAGQLEKARPWANRRPPL